MASCSPIFSEIEDMTKDVRTIDNPLVQGDPNVRFYAGAALTSEEGIHWGCCACWTPSRAN